MRNNSFLQEYESSECQKYKTKKVGAKITATQIDNNTTRNIIFEEDGVFEIVGELRKPIQTETIHIEDGFYLHIPLNGQVYGFITHGKKDLESFITKGFFESY